MEDGRPAYTTPHQQFTLAQNEVRELLMGDQLYGDPDLAIREMYQNALDACRYRQARLNFLGRSGKKFNWQGKIVFRQGLDRGRQFVECEDNGIGMGAREIESCFSRAGKRFADLPEFIEEQELWLQCNPKIEITPNSQFGIGVLSYFMIADEIELTTCRLDREGRTGRPLSIRIPGGGTLFRVQPAASVADAGTRVRLYLREDWNKSCCDILEKLLFVAEFDTKATDGGRCLVWLPGRAPDRYMPTGNPDFWWASDIDGGQVLVDGIAIMLPDEDLGRNNQPFGALINLRNERRPKLTVDRKKILEFDRPWVLAAYAEQVSSLLDAPWLRFTWLWRLPFEIRAAIDQHLIDSEVEIPIGYGKELYKSSHLNWSTSESIFDALPQLRELGFPLRVTGLNDDSRCVAGLAEALVSPATSPTEKLDRLNHISSELLTFGRPTHSPQKEMWSEAKLAGLLEDDKFRRDSFMHRAALYVKLGFPAPEWLNAYLPLVEVETIFKAKKLEEPLTLPPPPRKTLLQRIGVVFRTIGGAIEKVLNRLPDWLLITLFLGAIGIAGHFVIEWVKFAWGFIW